MAMKIILPTRNNNINPGTKSGTKKKLSGASIRHKLYAKEVAKKGRITEAYKKVYGVKDDNVAHAAGSRLLRNVTVRKEISRILDGVGATREKGARVISEGLRAMEVKIATEDGKITDEKKYADYPMRHRYVETLFRLHGDLKQPGSTPDDPVYTKGMVVMLPSKGNSGKGK